MLLIFLLREHLREQDLLFKEQLLHILLREQMVRVFVVCVLIRKIILIVIS